MNEDTLSLKDIRLAIPYLPKVARALLNKGKDYDPLLLEILRYDAFSEDDQPFPSNKETKLHLSPGKLRAQTERLYQDFLESMSGPDTAFCSGDILVNFYIRDYLNVNSVSISAKIQVMPRVGEQIDFPFLRPIFHIGACYVQSIHHYIENDKQNITIWVKSGFFNLYEHFELEKAKSEHRYDWKTDSITEPGRTFKNNLENRRRYWGKHW